MITALAIIILLLIAVILFIISKNKRTRTAAVLNALQHNLHSDGMGIDKRLNSNFKVSMDDNESIDKSSLYHEPFNVNMYTSAASGCTLNDMQRLHVTPDYTGKQSNLFIIIYFYYFLLVIKRLCNLYLPLYMKLIKLLILNIINNHIIHQCHG